MGTRSAWMRTIKAEKITRHDDSDFQDAYQPLGGFQADVSQQKRRPSAWGDLTPAEFATPGFGAAHPHTWEGRNALKWSNFMGSLQTPEKAESEILDDLDRQHSRDRDIDAAAELHHQDQKS